MLVSLDHKLTLAFYGFAKRQIVVRQVARFCASVLIWVLAAFVVIGLAMESPFLGLPILVGAFFVGHIVNAAAEHYRWRDRPYKTHGFEPLIATGWLHGSFPSDHTMMAFVLAGVWVGMGGTWMWVAITMATLIALGRVSVGVHYVSDIIVGAAVGMLSSVAFLLLF